MKTALLSVTFRKMGIAEIAALAAKGGVDAIEWGSDVHVKAGDMEAANLAVSACREHGLSISAYGSYYRCGDEDFAPYLETAKHLGVSLIRVWAGNIESSETLPEEERMAITEKLRAAVKLAEGTGITIATEYHPNTLTDTLESAQRLLSDVPGLYTYWQVNNSLTVEENLAEIDALQDKIVNAHAFYFEDGVRLPFSRGKAAWEKYLAKLNKTQCASVGLEFVLGGTAEQFIEDAKALKELIK